MKPHMAALWSCVLILCPLSSSQSTLTEREFLVNSAKQYVYLEFDHVGQRQPADNQEPHSGIWLRLVNNCRLPISVAIFNSGDNQISAYDEIVSAERKFPVVRVNNHGAQVDEHAPPPKNVKLPNGYALAEVFSTTTIPPGNDLLFSVPTNHVSPYWSLQLRFYFELPPGTSYGTGPYSVVRFDWVDLPKKVQRALSDD